MATYEVRLGERVLRVEVRRGREGVFVRLDGGPEQPATFHQVRGVLHSLVLGERRHELLADTQGAEARVVVGGLEYTAQVLDEAHARLAAVAVARAGGHTRRELKAPMPGLVVKVLCQAGDQVAANQPLAVLQAMKMENELSLPHGGAVVQVNVSEGQTVDQNQILVVVE